VRGRSVWLRVSRVDRVYAYHASLDGTAWQMIRVFVLDDETSRDKIGFEGQSPTGDGCSVTFDEIRFLSLGVVAEGEVHGVLLRPGPGQCHRAVEHCRLDLKYCGGSDQRRCRSAACPLVRE
jgi:Protein of unknown function (DUF1349)